MMTPVLRFEQGVRSHVGCVRTVNEDAQLARLRDGLWLVADGMGGHLNGQWASATIVGNLEAVPLADGFDAACATVVAGLEAANAEIYDAALAAGGAIGSTVVVLLVRDMRCAIFWVGDSRVYRQRGANLTQLTTDHSQVEHMVLAGLISREEAETHPLASVLSRAVGVRPDLPIDRIDIPVVPGDIFLLCSDGLTRTMSADEIGALLDREPPRHAASALVDLALDRQAPDNVTVVVVGCDATTIIGAG